MTSYINFDMLIPTLMKNTDLSIHSGIMSCVGLFHGSFELNLLPRTEK